MGNKLELTWYGKDEQIKVEPRLLIHDSAKDYGEKETENMLIHGDNLLALKALEKDYAGKIKCIYIDPPYNTGSAFEHYDDNLEHSQWLSLIKPRLELLRGLLKEDGSIWISIDDDEGHYLKVLCDEIFGRSNFVSTVIWEKNILLKKVKGEDRLEAADVLAKKDRALRYCKVVLEWGRANGYKEWDYVLIPSKQITENSTFGSLAKSFMEYQ